MVHTAVARFVLLTQITLLTGCSMPQMKGRLSASSGVETSVDLCPAQLPAAVTWDDHEQLAFAEAASAGPVVVQRSGCRVRVLRDCRVADRGGYRSQMTTPASNHLQTEVAGSAMLGVLGVGAGVDTTHHFSSDYRVVGRRDTDLSGRVVLYGSDCRGATHVVEAYTTGAYSTQISHHSRGDASGPYLQGSVGSGATRNVAYGDLAACSSQGAAGLACGAAVNLKLAPLAQLCAGHHCREAAPAPPVAQARNNTPAVVPTPFLSPGLTKTCQADLQGCASACRQGDTRRCLDLGLVCSLGNQAACGALGWQLSNPLTIAQAGRAGAARR